MKKGLIIGIIIAFIVILVIVLFFILKQDKDYDFKPSIEQGVYGTALKCEGSAMPPSKGKISTVQITFKIENSETQETFEVTTQDNGRYEYSLEEGSYKIIYTNFLDVEDTYDLVEINTGSLIKKNIMTRMCPV